jgi:hypothetical protein
MTKELNSFGGLSLFVSIAYINIKYSIIIDIEISKLFFNYLASFFNYFKILTINYPLIVITLGVILVNIVLIGVLIFFSLQVIINIVEENLLIIKLVVF